MYCAKKAAALCFCFIISISLAACTTRTTEEKLTEINDRLSLVDEFYENSAPELMENSVDPYKSASFRGIPFGSFRTSVKSRESLEITSEYTNAIDYAPAKFLDYDMVPTYWFNSSDQLYSGSYYMSAKVDLEEFASNITNELKGIYGQALDINYYDYDNNLITVSESENISDLVDRREAYYFAWFAYDNIDVELIIERSLSDQSQVKYDIIIYYIDDSYDF